MARQLEHFDNLVAMFFARAEEKGDAPFLWAKSDGEWRPTSWREAARQVAALAAALAAHRAAARRPGHAGLGEPAGMADLRSRDHGRRLRHRADLRHQHRARSPAYPRRQRRPRGDRLDPEAGEDPAPGRAPLIRCEHVIGIEELRPARSRQHPVSIDWARSRSARRTPTSTPAPPPADLRARRSRLHHLHLRHRRRAARGDAASRRDPAQCRRLRRHHRRGFRLGRRGVPLLPPRQPRL